MMLPPFIVNSADPAIYTPEAEFALLPLMVTPLLMISIDLSLQ
jgi:hypothetical protein